ncbi:hypothetical protein Vadar_010592 [Vaccinium darrowii]|uniref:Uncharacterized protein n=1 Tax=Vaccinium darrowii TaxID=229202 RepID=A0ACB7XH10_9ERIC|nr:hypothetical protein Vadar_010592 [Vaccinium darrowii]
MSVPRGYLFMPTDEELLVFYLGRKSKGLPLPCDIVIERDMYGVHDKAPWQVFKDEDPWKISKTRDDKGNIVKTEGTIYVFTTLIKASKNRIARTAGCGVWHAETALEKVWDDHGRVIGYKRMMCFQITNESGMTDRSERKGHWIMHEYSLCGGNTDESRVEYVLCRIKRDDSKSTKKSRTVKNLEVASADDEVIAPKPTKRLRTEFVEEQKMFCDIVAAPQTEVIAPQTPKRLRTELLEEQKMFGDIVAAPRTEVTTDHDVMGPKLAKRVRTEFVEEHKMVCDIDAATETEVMPFVEEVVVQEPSFTMSDDPNEFTLEEFLALWEQERQGSHSSRMSDEPVSLLESEEQPSFDHDFDAFGYDPLTPEVVPSGHILASSAPVALDTSQDMVAGYIEEPVSLLESKVQQSFDLAFDAFGNNLFTPEDTSQEQFMTYLLEQDLPYQENLWSGEPNCFGVGLLV